MSFFAMAWTSTGKCDEQRSARCGSPTYCIKSRPRETLVLYIDARFGVKVPWKSIEFTELSHRLPTDGWAQSANRYFSVMLRKKGGVVFRPRQAFDDAFGTFGRVSARRLLLQ